jgi:hypothetical protein
MWVRTGDQARASVRAMLSRSPLDGVQVVAVLDPLGMPAIGLERIGTSSDTPSVGPSS